MHCVSARVRLRVRAPAAANHQLPTASCFFYLFLFYCIMYVYELYPRHAGPFHVRVYSKLIKTFTEFEPSADRIERGRFQMHGERFGSAGSKRGVFIFTVKYILVLNKGYTNLANSVQTVLQSHAISCNQQNNFTINLQSLCNQLQSLGIQHLLTWNEMQSRAIGCNHLFSL